MRHRLRLGLQAACGGGRGAVPVFADGGGHRFQRHLAAFAGRQVADEPGHRARGEVMPAAVGGRVEFAALRQQVDDADVAGRGAAGVGDLERVGRVPVQVAELRPGNCQVHSRQHYFEPGHVLGGQAGVGRGAAFDRVRPRRAGQADHLHGAALARHEVAQLHLDLLAAGVL